MNGRLGNGMALWLGGALLAHAALLAVPSAHMPDGQRVANSGLSVQLKRSRTIDSTPETDRETDVTATESVDSIPKELGSVSLIPETDLALGVERSGTKHPAPVFEQQAAAAPAPVSTAASEPPAETTSDEPVSALHSSDPSAAAELPAHADPEMGSDPISAMSEEKVSDTFPDASTALAGQQVILATARQTSMATLSLDDPVQNPAGAPNDHDYLRLLELTDRLHRAIEREKRYPLSARRLGREGTASVAFRLRPDGAIDAVEVAASSGEPALDRAALRAVSGISPFAEARAYLDASAPFQIDIAFRLH